MYKSILAMLTFTIYGSLADYCPNDTTILSPCTCDDSLGEKYRAIICGGSHELNIRDIFLNLSMYLLGADTHFSTFYLNNTKISELPGNAFVDITFTSVNLINAYNLSQMHSKALGNIVDSIRVENTPIDTGTFAYEGIFEAAKFSQTFYLILRNTSVKHIPTNAFNGQYMSEIDISHHSRLTWIDKYAFQDMPNLQVLRLNDNSIAYLYDNAFSVGQSAYGQQLVVDLRGNQLSQAELISTKAFDGMTRAVYLHLEDQEFTVVPRDIYEGYLKSNKSHILETSFVHDNCSDPGNDWIKHDYPGQVILDRCDI